MSHEFPVQRRDLNANAMLPQQITVHDKPLYPLSAWCGIGRRSLVLGKRKGDAWSAPPFDLRACQKPSGDYPSPGPSVPPVNFSSSAA
jgi:hypothetical protein